ncbi:MAG: hypothetical protein JXA25_08040 [Anaerolineales bacterium]|nr:hypothetical protein [Anaerolineales bacterium]
MSDDMSEVRETNPEAREQTENREETALEDSTVNPGSRIEQTQNFSTAEAIETALSTSIENTLAPAAEVTSQTRNNSEPLIETVTVPASSGENVSAVPTNLPDTVAMQAEEAPTTLFSDAGTTPVNPPNLVESQVETSPVLQELVSEDPDHGPNPIGEAGENVSAVPTNLPDTVAMQAEEAPTVLFSDAGTTPVNPPNLVESQAETSPVLQELVSEDPDHGPNPIGEVIVLDLPEVSSFGEDVTETAINLSGLVESQAESSPVLQELVSEVLDYSSDPIVEKITLEDSTEFSPVEYVNGAPANLPDTVDLQAEKAPASLHSNIGATPIIPSGLQEAQTEKGPAESESSAPPEGEGMPAPPLPSPENEPAEPTSIEEAIAVLEPEDSEPADEELDEKMRQELMEKWETEMDDLKAQYLPLYNSEKPYVYLDKEGNATLVKESGEPIENPPQIIYFEGKYYCYFPGEEIPIGAEGAVNDEHDLWLHELPYYSPITEDVYIYTSQDGSTVVVYDNGIPVESPPQLIQDPSSGKYYFINYYAPAASVFESFLTSGDFASFLSQGYIVEASGYQPPTEGLQVYTGHDGSLVVVDENGKPVDSPPGVVQDPETGKFYLIPDFDPSLTDPVTGGMNWQNFADAVASGSIQEAPGYQPSTQGLQVYTNQDGSVMVVDENGKTVDCPPGVIRDPNTGKYYFVTGSYPGMESPGIYDPSGEVNEIDFIDAIAYGILEEASSYTPSTEGLQVYTSQDGSMVVVDENGKAVDHPPAIYLDAETGKYYLVADPDINIIGPDGAINWPDLEDAMANGSIQETSGYIPSTAGLQIYTGEAGSTVVVDENGKPVECPPAVIQDPSTGKYYFITETDPGKLSTLTSGNFASAIANGVIQEVPEFDAPLWYKAWLFFQSYPDMENPYI